MRFKKTHHSQALGNKNFEEKETPKKQNKTKQNKTAAAGESFCFGYYSW
jgi:hypothetical protein